MSERQRTEPLVSIVMVARNTAPFINSALLSARQQTLENIEILVVDDESTDGTAEIVQDHAATDHRVRLIAGPQQGLAAVRNVSLAAARGRFLAILDSDDALHPRHLQMLLAAHKSTGAEICAANMLMFSDNHGLQARPFASERRWTRAQNITAEDFVRCGMIGSDEVSLGYLKPFFEAEFLRNHAFEYDRRLRIGEDFDLVLRAMLAGAQLHFVPEATYYYRRHGASTSHRLSAADLEGLAQAARGYPAKSPGMAKLLNERLINLEGARRQVLALDALRRGRIWKAVRLTKSHPEARRLVMSSIHESVRKRVGFSIHGELNPIDGERNEGKSLAAQTQDLQRILCATKYSNGIGL